MPTINSVLQNVENYLANKLETAVTQNFSSELRATVDELLHSPQLPIKSSLKSLFIRYGLDEQIIDNLVKSLQTVIKQNQEHAFEPKNLIIDKIDFPKIIENQDYLASKLQAENVRYEDFPTNSLINLIEQAALIWAKVVGSNVAEALALADPNTVINLKGIVKTILHGKIVDPIILVNSFQSLSEEQRKKLTTILSNSITIAKQNNESRNLNMLKENRAEQWLYEKLRANYFPHDTAVALIPYLLQEYSIDTLYEINDKQFRDKVVRIIRMQLYN